MAVLRKPLRGEHRLEIKERRHDRRAEEDAEKDKCRFRDKRCRYPHCPYCRRYKDLIPQAAHVIQAKGMSGDRACEFWREDIPGQKYLVARETAPFIYEHD